MKRILPILSLVGILTIALTACGQVAQSSGGEDGAALYSNLTAAQERQEVSDLLSAAGIGNVAIKTFFALCKDYNDVVGDQPYFQEGFAPLPKGGVDYDAEDTYSLWMDQRSYSDANCRITAYGLLRGQITAAAPGTADSFLAGDQDALDHYTQCGLSEDEKGVFYALFNPASVAATTDAKAVSDAFLAEWKARGIAFQEGDARLISVVFNSELDDIAYVGHAGVLVPDGDGWLFVEKYAPAYPYQAAKFQTRDEVEDYLMGRFGEQYTKGVTAKPFLLENDRPF